MWMLAAAGFLLALTLVVIVGLRVRPSPFPAPASPGGQAPRVPLPAGLPAPVERFYRVLYGDTVPVYLSAVLTGRGTLRLRGVALLARLRFTHVTGRGYRHDIEVTFFGVPVLRVDERYFDGHARFALPMGVQEDNPDLDSAANLGLWAETLTYPAALLTDKRVRWEPIDATSARLLVPFRDGHQAMTVTFDPETHLATRIEADRRYADAARGYVRWWGTLDAWAELGGVRMPIIQGVHWADEDRPWLHLRLEHAVFNAEVEDRVRLPQS